MNFDLSESILTAGAVLLIILFWGNPDLMDVLLYKLSDGQIAIPKP